MTKPTTKSAKQPQINQKKARMEVLKRVRLTVSAALPSTYEPGTVAAGFVRDCAAVPAPQALNGLMSQVADIISSQDVTLHETDVVHIWMRPSAPEAVTLSYLIVNPDERGMEAYGEVKIDLVAETKTSEMPPAGVKVH